MLQVAIMWGFYSIVMLIVEAIKHSSKMSSTVPCQVTARLTSRQPKNKTSASTHWKAIMMAAEFPTPSRSW